MANVGRWLRTNSVDITPERVRKTYRNFSVTMLWGFLERKPYASATTRYLREKEIIPELRAAGLNTPELISHDDSALTLDMVTLEFSDLVEVFMDPRIHKDDKLDLFGHALYQLNGIHNLGHTHGDPYMKNFFRLDRVYPDRGPVYTCDFEYRRKSPNPQLTDLLILTADATELLNGTHPEEAPATLSLVQQVYSTHLHFPFALRDQLFFRARFGMGKQFFDYFR